MNVTKRLIPVNFSKGRSGFKPMTIVLHLMDGTLKGTDAWFRNPKSQASTHYGVGKKGEVYQWVAEADTAWGNGRVYKPTWKLVRPENPNLYTVSIEHEGVSGHIWTEEQYKATAELVQQIAKRWDIPLDRDHIITHSEIYALKPSCTGPGLDMDKFMALVSPTTSLQNVLVKGATSPSVYWADGKGILHSIPSWEFYLEFFNGEIKVLDQKVVDALKKGLPFTKSA